MILDTHAYLGHYAFRQLRHNTAPALLALMDRKRIDKAMVSSASAITYKNTQSGNEELAAEVKGHADRLIPFAVINPFYAGWRDDLKTCREEFGMRGVRLHPAWHNYTLADRCCAELVDAATELGMVVSIVVRVEDPRDASWLVEMPDLPVREMANLVKAHPSARFMLQGGTGYASTPLGRKDGGLPANYVIDTTRLSSLMGNELGQLIQNLGADRLVFGTGMPFFYPDPALLSLEVLDATEPEKEKIHARNAAAFLERPGSTP